MTKKRLLIILAVCFTIAPVVLLGKWEVLQLVLLLVGYLLTILAWIGAFDSSKMPLWKIVLSVLGLLVLQTYIYLLMIWFFVN